MTAPIFQKEQRSLFIWGCGVLFNLKNGGRICICKKLLQFTTKNCCRLWWRPTNSKGIIILYTILSTIPNKKYKKYKSSMLLKTFFTSSLKRYSNIVPKIKKKLLPFWKATMKVYLTTSKAKSFSIEGSLNTLLLKNGPVPLSPALIPSSKCRISNSSGNCSNIKK